MPRVRHAGALGGRQLAALAAVDEHAPGARAQQPGDTAQERRLAASVRTEEAERPAGLERVVHAGEHDPSAVGVPDTAELEPRRGHERMTSSDTVPR